MLFRSETGSLLTSKTRLFEPRLSKRRDLDKLVPSLRQHGAMAQTRVGELDIVLLRARDVMAACHRLAADGVFCYGP